MTRRRSSYRRLQTRAVAAVHGSCVSGWGALP